MTNRFDTVIFDLDSTLVSIEGLSYLSEQDKFQDLPLIRASLDGAVPLKLAFQNEMILISPTYREMLKLGTRYKQAMLDNSKELIEILHLLGKEVWLITNSFHPSIDIAANFLNIPLSNVFGNHVFFDEYGVYQGYDKDNPLTKNGGKVEVIKRHIHPDKKVVMIGDGIPDLETEPVVDLFIGYGGVVSRPSVKKRAPVFINTPDLIHLTKFLLNEEELATLKKNSIQLHS